jgi:hypothetical protein
MHRNRSVLLDRQYALCVLTIAVGLSPSVAQARDIEVDPATLNAALSGLMPGDHIRLAPGQYAHFTIGNVVGTADMPITISGPEDGSATIQADIGPCCNTIQIAGNVSYLVIRNLTVDGLGVDGAFGIDARGPEVHHITIENCTFVHHDAHQQTVAISTKTPTSGWIIRGNRILGAGTGMYLGNSDGTHAFVEGLIENNLFYDTIGYNVQIKWQQPHDPVPGASGGPSATIIRHNVFIKTDRPSDDGDRPNLLIGGFATTGPNSEDTYQIYGNVFLHNPRESLIQASGRVSIHDNVFFDSPTTAIRLQNHDLPLRRAWIYQNTFLVNGAAINFGASAPEGSLVVGNLIFANTAIFGAAGEVRDNITDIPGNAGMYVRMAGTTLGSVDFFPANSRSSGAPIDLSSFATDIDYDRDFNCQSKGDFSFRGAYSGSGTNPGWMLAMENKPACGSSPRPDAGVASLDGGAGDRSDAAIRSDAALMHPDGSMTSELHGGCGCRVVARRGSTFVPALGMFALAMSLVFRASYRHKRHRTMQGD